MLPIRNVLTSLRIQEEKKSNGNEKIHELRVTFEPYGAREDRYIIVSVKDGLRRNKYTHTHTLTRARARREQHLDRTGKRSYNNIHRAYTGCFTVFVFYSKVQNLNI